MRTTFATLALLSIAALAASGCRSSWNPWSTAKNDTVTSSPLAQATTPGMPALPSSGATPPNVTVPSNGGGQYEAAIAAQGGYPTTQASTTYPSTAAPDYSTGPLTTPYAAQNTPYNPNAMGSPAASPPANPYPSTPVASTPPASTNPAAGGYPSTAPATASIPPVGDVGDRYGSPPASYRTADASAAGSPYSTGSRYDGTSNPPAAASPANSPLGGRYSSPPPSTTPSSNPYNANPTGSYPGTQPPAGSATPPVGPYRPAGTGNYVPQGGFSHQQDESPEGGVTPASYTEPSPLTSQSG